MYLACDDNRDDSAELLGGCVRASLGGMQMPNAERVAYGAARRPNWLAIGGIVAAHVVLLGALAAAKLDMIAPSPAPPLVVTLVPVPLDPPPAPPPAAEPVEVEPVQRLAAPEPIVVTPMASLPVIATPIASPVEVARVVALPLAAATPGPALPVSPPTPLAGGAGNAAPKYPMEARRRKQQGTVRLRVVVSIEGRVRDISVARSSGFDSLDEAALAAVARWRFTPAVRAGEPIEGVGYVPIPFRLT